MGGEAARAAQARLEPGEKGHAHAEAVLQQTRGQSPHTDKRAEAGRVERGPTHQSTARGCDGALRQGDLDGRQGASGQGAAAGAVGVGTALPVPDPPHQAQL